MIKQKIEIGDIVALKGPLYKWHPERDEAYNGAIVKDIRLSENIRNLLLKLTKKIPLWDYSVFPSKF